MRRTSEGCRRYAGRVPVAMQVIPRGPRALAVIWSAPRRSRIRRATSSEPPPSLRTRPRQTTRPSRTSTTCHLKCGWFESTLNRARMNPLSALSLSLEVALSPQEPATRTSSSDARAEEACARDAMPRTARASTATTTDARPRVDLGTDADAGSGTDQRTVEQARSRPQLDFGRC